MIYMNHVQNARPQNKTAAADAEICQLGVGYLSVCMIYSFGAVLSEFYPDKNLIHSRGGFQHIH
jgi:hypothetical protein